MPIDDHVYRRQAPSGERADVLTIPQAASLPGILLQDREALSGLPTEPEPFDASADAPEPPPAPVRKPGHSHGSET